MAGMIRTIVICRECGKPRAMERGRLICEECLERIKNKKQLNRLKKFKEKLENDKS